MPREHSKAARLAAALVVAETKGDSDAIVEAENDIAHWLGLDPDHTEQGLTQEAADAVDEFLREQGFTVRGRDANYEARATEHAANIAKLHQLAQDSELKMAEFTSAGRQLDAAHYAGMRDGLLRAINVLEGRG